MTLRVGIVGVGWGSHVQVPGFRAAAGFEPVALCGRSPERLAKASARVALDDVSTDWASFVTRDDLDVISVATPTSSHAEIALAALAAGKAVLCEKPLTDTLESARALVTAAQQSGRPTACGFENRWNPGWLAVADLVRSDYLGLPYVARVSRSASYWHPTRPLQAPWMYDKDQGGGYLAGMLVHDLDLVAHLLGAPVQVCADARTSVPVRDLPDGEHMKVSADDTAALMLRFESGAFGLLSVSVVGAHADHYRLELFGSDGTIIGEGTLRDTQYVQGVPADAGLSSLSMSTRTPAHPDELPDGLAGHASRALALMLEDWLPAFHGGESTAATFRDGLVSLAVIDAARRSAAGAGWVDVDL